MAPNLSLTLSQFPTTALDTYTSYELSRLDRKHAMFHALPEEHRNLLPEFSQRLSKLAECIEANLELLADIAASASNITSSHPSPDNNPESFSPESQSQISHSIRRGFLLLARDWGTDSKCEQYRSVLYNPLIAAINEAFGEAKLAQTSLIPTAFRVLVSAAGTGRLAWELSKRGYSVEGCESSPIAMAFGNYALNATSMNAPKTVYPYVHETSNCPSVTAATHAITMPDVEPSSIPATNFIMRTGDLIAGYVDQHSMWDCICSCFSLDLSENSLLFTRKVMQLLKPGGVWAFIGPAPSVQESRGGVLMSVEEFMGVLRRVGLKVVKREEVVCEWIGDGGGNAGLKDKTVSSWLVVCVKVRPAP